MIDVWQYFEYAFDSEYAAVLNMLGSRMILNRIFIIDIWQGLDYASSSEYANVTQGSIENGPSNSTGSQYARAWIYKRCEYVKVIQCSV